MDSILYVAVNGVPIESDAFDLQLTGNGVELSLPPGSTLGLTDVFDLTRVVVSRDGTRTALEIVKGRKPDARYAQLTNADDKGARLVWYKVRDKEYV